MSGFGEVGGFRVWVGQFNRRYAAGGTGGWSVRALKRPATFMRRYAAGGTGGWLVRALKRPATFVRRYAAGAKWLANEDTAPPHKATVMRRYAAEAPLRAGGRLGWSRSDPMMVAVGFNPRSRINRSPRVAERRLKSIPRIASVIFDFVTFQESDVLLLKRPGPVMLTLTQDIGSHVQQAGLADGKRPIPILPLGPPGRMPGHTAGRDANGCQAKA